MKMKKTGNLMIIFFAILLASCKKTGSDTDLNSVEDMLTGEGVFIINEGNYLSGNGSLSFYSYGSGEIYNNIFSKANGRPLGDIPYSMEISGNKGYIVVNNSGNIEVVDKNTMLTIKTISGLVSPRNILLINTEKAYVSSLYSNSLSIVNLLSGTIVGSIKIRRSSEAMVLSGNKAYVASWYSGKDIMVLNTSSDNVIDSIEVAPEPESIVLDKNNKLWVLCNGGYTRQNFAELIVVNTASDEIERHFVFPAKSLSPSGLQINSTRDTLYYIENGLWQMSIQSNALPSKPFKTSSNRLIYKLGIDRRNGRIFYTDAMDYQQKGYVLQLNSMGKTIDSCRADIIPGSFCFK
jgi:YVTN family beta-propeller protein